MNFCVGSAFTSSGGGAKIESATMIPNTTNEATASMNIWLGQKRPCVDHLAHGVDVGGFEETALHGRTGPQADPADLLATVAHDAARVDRRLGAGRDRTVAPQQHAAARIDEPSPPVALERARARLDDASLRVAHEETAGAGRSIRSNDPLPHDIV